MKIEIKLEELNSEQHRVYFKYAHSEREKIILEKTLEHGIWGYENELKWLKDCLKTYNQLVVNNEKINLVEKDK
ncbi:hypothetical protein NYE71_29650 [Bacillus sp. FSL K6-0273]|uniref:hypothetical protein n=1 Tax=Bacillus TaxID=1386 RepID=UPI0009BCF434|nr:MULTISPECIES: hypothetical protein [Bacillus cereus group]PDZ89777.1 hypothetical protein CON47_20805 [Bacillus thuringiensis]PGL46601.1 hypothetical protein CN914_23750 [Bacillus thuringiensis]